MSQLNQTFALKQRSRLGYSECLAPYVSRVSASQRLLGFAVSSNIECKVSPLLPQDQSGKIKTLEVVVGMTAEVPQKQGDQILTGRAVLAMFPSAILMF